MLFKNKSLLLIIAISFILVHSCIKSPEPSFSIIPATNPEAGDTIFFLNNSVNATAYLWDLGNGEISTMDEPFTIYDFPGSYEVTLKAMSKQKADSISEIITIKYPTIMAFYIFYRDSIAPVYDSISPLEDCNAWVFDNETDWLNWINGIEAKEPAFFDMTNEDGFVSFSNLEAQVYYLLFYKATATGEYITGGYTETLELNTANLYSDIANFYESEKKSTSGSLVLSPVPYSPQSVE